MTSVLESENPPAPAGSPAAAGGPGRALMEWIRRHRTWTALILVFSLGVGLTIVAQLSPRGDHGPLSTRNAAPEGARAAAEILRNHGVDVSQTDTLPDSLAALDRAKAGGRGATLLLYDRNGYLDRGQLQALQQATDRLVVVTPRLNTLSALDAGITPAGVVPQRVSTLEPGCGLDDPAAAGAVTAEAAYLYEADSVCYQPVEGLGGIYASSDDGRLVVLGSSQMISNRLLDEHGNAALVLRTLGASDNLVWYLPGIADVTVEDRPKTLDELAPPWVAFLGPWLALVAVLAMFWRGRRLGPLVFEPLPVVVKAVETAEGRARLYHDAHAVDRAADNLRAGTLVRLARFLRLGPDAESTAIVHGAARHLGRTPEETAQVLEARPRTESELVRWAQQLESLEKEVTAR